MRIIGKSLLSASILFFTYSPLTAADYGVAYTRPLPDEAAAEIAGVLNGAGVRGYTIDLNVRVHVPVSANPYIPADEVNDDLWATVIRPNTTAKLPTVIIPAGYTRVFAVLAANIVPHGYNFMIMDVRGSGSSGGEWTAFDLVEQYDIKYVIDNWIPGQAWSDGKVALYGLSAMAISSVLAAGLVDRDSNGVPVHLKAALPMAFLTDPYRDIVFQGGNMNIEIFFTWISLTSVLSALPPFLFLGENGIPPALDDIEEATDIWMTHIKQIPKDIGWMMDSSRETRTLCWKQKSPMIYWPVKPKEGWGFYEGDNCTIPPKLPVFQMSGWFDIFTRGTLNNYQYGLSEHSDSDKAMIIGEWGHGGACSGFGIPALELFKFHVRWMDWKVKGKEDCFMKDFPVLMRVMGEKRWRAEKSWPLPESRLEKRTLYLSKRKAGAIDADFFTNDSRNRLYSLVETPTIYDLYGDNPEMKHWIEPAALHGMMSKSSQRWMYGGMLNFSEVAKFWFGRSIDEQVFWEDERSDDWKIPTFTTEPLSKDLEITGPALLKFFARTDFTYPATQYAVNLVAKAVEAATGVSSNMIIDMMNKKDVQFVVEVDDVFPDGRARNITSGWLMASHRQYDPHDSIYEDEHAVDPDYTPFDPFYDRPDAYPKMIEEGDLYQYAVELWPTCNVFKAGHRIRITITGSDVPHFIPVLRPSTNIIVIDENHLATLEFSTTNKKDEGVTWQWIGPAGDIIDNTFNNYLLYDKDQPDVKPVPDPVIEEPVADDNQEIIGDETEIVNDDYITEDATSDPGDNKQDSDEITNEDNTELGDAPPASGCGSSANAAYHNSARPLLPELAGIFVLMSFPFALVFMHRRLRRRR